MTPAHARTARLAYVAIVLVATLSNLHLDPSLADVPARLARALDLTPRLSEAIDAIRNVLLFAGLGAVWVATSRLKRPMATLLRLTIISLIMSGCIEALQLFSPVRDASLIDVTTDTLGGLAGGVITLAAFALVDETTGRRSYFGVPALLFAVCYGVATMTEAFFPLFRQDLLPQLGGSIGDRIGRAVAAMQPASITQIPVIDLLVFFPVGVLAMLALIELGITGVAAALITICFAAVVYPTIEVIHGVAALPISIGAAITHVVAVSLGALFATYRLKSFGRDYSTQQRAGFIAVAYSIAIMFWSWRPFQLDFSARSMADQFTSSHLVPLKALAERGDLFSVTDVIAQGLLFIPLGALLAVWPVRRKGPLSGMLPALYLAVILETGKIPIAERFMDVTHILIQGAGVALGYLLVRRVGYQVRGELFKRD